ncbi:MerR family transcriptional regulator [Streptomyces sp. DT225]
MRRRAVTEDGQGRGPGAELVTIGAFARLSRLSAKALRRYDELGLLPPALVDPVNGYRYYDPAQVRAARLVAWLRRIGMPLARIREVIALESGAAAAAIRAYWARVEAETAARRDLAAFLIDQLSTEDVMTSVGTLGFRYAARTDTGAVRETNQDAVYAGARLLAVADGFGAGGAGASTAAIEALKPFAPGAVPAAEPLAVRDAVAGSGSGSPAESGTTLTAVMWTGSRLGLVHIGDSRAYLLRGGELFRITHDHSLVQSMIDDGSLTEEEAFSHPQRAMLLKVLGGDGPYGSGPDVDVRDALPGDRYLLCSDGLSAVVDGGELARVLAAADGPSTAVGALIELAEAAGAPDNVACAVADVVEL